MIDINECVKGIESTRSIEEMFNETEIGNLNELDGIDCPKCKNRGYFLKEGEFGVSEYITCECMIQRKVKRITNECGMGDLLNYRINQYKPTTREQGEMKKIAYDYVTQHTNEWLMLTGESGSGKTMLCSAVCNALISKGIEVKYISWNDYCNEYKSNLRSNLPQYESLFKCDVLYIDDLFKGSRSEFDVKTIAYDLINYRYNNKLITIISTEVLFNELIDLDTAIAGRIKQMCKGYTYEIKGKENNYRLNG